MTDTQDRPHSPRAVGIAIPSWSTKVVRPDDLMVLTFSFYNLELNYVDLGDGETPVLERRYPEKEAYISVGFPFQHLSEDVGANEQEADESPPEMPPVLCVAAPESRLVFRLPGGVHMIRYQMSSEPRCLLDWNNLVLNRVAAAVPPDFDPSQTNNVPELSEPQPRHTSIWMPDGLVLSPLGREVWHHDDVVRKVGGRCLLWHTFASDTLEGDNLRLRAVWSRYLHPDPGHRDFPSSRGEPPVSPRVLHQIVHLTSNFGAGIRDRVSTLTSRYLMLSAFGAWVDAKGQWELGIQGIDLSEWFQRVSMGRDQYVRLARDGYLFPFGHRATCVDISERKLYAHELESLGVRAPFAHLRRHTLLIVREREKTYPEADEKTKRAFPFRRVRIEPEVTPKLDRDCDDSDSSAIFWPEVGGERFLFKISAEDWDGHWLEFRYPLAWVSTASRDENEDGETSRLDDSLNDLNRSLRENGGFCADLQGQNLTFAPASSEPASGENTDSCCFPVHALAFEAVARESSPASEVWFHPQLVGAALELPAAERISGAATGILAVKFDDLYLTDGFGAKNPGQVFANFTTEIGNESDSGFDLDLPAEKIGGLAAMKLRLTALSRRFGPTVGNGSQLDGFAQSRGNGAFGLGKWLADARLLGGVDLASLVADVWQEGTSIPAIVSYRTGEGAVTELDWSPIELNSTTEVKVYEETELRISASFNIPKNASESPRTARIQGKLTNFDLLVLPDFLELAFESLTFTDDSERAKPDFSASLRGVRFLGPLRFLDSLWRTIDLAGFSDPPSLDVDDSGVRVRYGLGIPELPFGSFVMRNLRLAAAMTLPFEHAPLSIRFAFGERHDPFQVFVSLLGGGAFFSVVLRSDGVEMLEGEIEFGGGLVIDLGIARGSVEAMVGIYFHLCDAAGADGEPTNLVALEGYQRCGGEVEVLGLVSVSVEFYMALAYEELNEGTRVVGRARVTVKVRVAFFKKSVGLEMERSFSGSAPQVFSFSSSAKDLLPGLSFAEVMSFGDVDLTPAERVRTEAAQLDNYWELYCDAFYAPPAGGQKS